MLVWKMPAALDPCSLLFIFYSEAAQWEFQCVSKEWEPSTDLVGPREHRNHIKTLQKANGDSKSFCRLPCSQEAREPGHCFNKKTQKWQCSGILSDYCSLNQPVPKFQPFRASLGWNLIISTISLSLATQTYPVKKHLFPLAVFYFSPTNKTILNEWLKGKVHFKCHFLRDYNRR